jgi:hypothetical protein
MSRAELIDDLEAMVQDLAEASGEPGDIADAKRYWRSLSMPMLKLEHENYTARHQREVRPIPA